jgi:hypothetical protein
MIPRQDISLRKSLLWCLIIACGLITAYLGFISLVIIWIGFGHLNESGFWVPILTGFLSLLTIFYASTRIIKHILNKMEEQDVVNI